MFVLINNNITLIYDSTTTPGRWPVELRACIVCIRCMLRSEDTCERAQFTYTIRTH